MPYPQCVKGTLGAGIIASPKAQPGGLERLESAARYRLASGRDVVASLRRAVALLPSHPSALAARVSAALIESCCDNSNAWVAADLHNKDGELFDSAGSLTSCCERLCPNCLRRRSAQSRRRAREGVARAAEKFAGVPGLRWRFVTLTFPTMTANSLPLVNALSLIQSSWRDLSRSRWWRDNVRAVVKGVEFTLGDKKRVNVNGWNPAREGYHAHVHLLVLSHWLNARELSLQWTAAVKMQIARRGLIAPRGTVEGRYFAHVELVTAKRGQLGSESLEFAVREVAKYITKCDSWSRLPSAQLLDVAAIARWPRMFELLGACRAPVEAKECGPFDADPATVQAFRDDLSRLFGPYFDFDALVASRAWNKSATTRGEVLRAYIQYARERWARGDGWLPLASIYTESLFVTELTRGSPPGSVPKRETMKQRGLALLRDGKEIEFLATLNFWLKDAREFRARQLRLKYPFARFAVVALT